MKLKEDADSRGKNKVKEDYAKLISTNNLDNCTYHAIKLYAPPYITRSAVTGGTLWSLASPNYSRCTTYNSKII